MPSIAASSECRRNRSFVSMRSARPDHGTVGDLAVLGE